MNLNKDNELKDRILILILIHCIFHCIYQACVTLFPFFPFVLGTRWHHPLDLNIEVNKHELNVKQLLCPGGLCGSSLNLHNRVGGNLSLSATLSEQQLIWKINKALWYKHQIIVLSN